MRGRLLTKLVLLAIFCAFAFAARFFVSTSAFAEQSNLRSTISGRVVERDTLNPLAVEISVTGREGSNLFVRHATASQAGLFEIADLPAGNVHLTTKLDGYAPEHLSVSLNDGETRHVEFYLTRGKVVRGVVQDAARNPVARASLTIAYAVEQTEARSIAATYQWERGEVTSDAMGRFAIKDVHPAREFVVAASHPDYLTAVSAPARISPDAGEVAVSLSLDRGITVIGQIRDEDGNLVQDAEVTLLDATRRPELLRFNSFELLKDGNKHTVSDTNGAFRFAQVRPVRKMLVVSHPGYQPLRQLVDITGQQAQFSVEVLLRSK